MNLISFLFALETKLEQALVFWNGLSVGAYFFVKSLQDSKYKFLFGLRRNLRIYRTVLESYLDCNSLLYEE